MATVLVTDPSVRSSIDWKAALWSGLISGLIFLVLEMVMVPLFLGGSPWAPPRMIGAIALGQGVLPNPPPPPTFDAGVVAVAMAIHFMLSAVFGVLVAFAVRRLSLGAALAVGAVVGVVLYLVNFYLFTGVFPWFAMARNWVSVFTHISFGVGAAWAYLGLTRRRLAA